jgi:hypothetical protein
LIGTWGAHLQTVRYTYFFHNDGTFLYVRDSRWTAGKYTTTNGQVLFSDVNYVDFDMNPILSYIDSSGKTIYYEWPELLIREYEIESNGSETRLRIGLFGIDEPYADTKYTFHSY